MLGAARQYRRQVKVFMLSQLENADMTESAAPSGLNLQDSKLFKEFQAEREEILRHKWLESERAGYDIGFERALIDWRLKHRSKWMKGRRSQKD